MYNTYTGGCNILNLQISRHKTIDVKSNNLKSWDHTNPILPVIEPRTSNSSGDMSMALGPGGSMNQGPGGNMGKNNMGVDHPLLPMPMNMAAAAAAAAAGHHFNSNSSPFLHNPHHQSHQGGSQHGSAQGPYNPAAAAAAAAAAVAAQSVTGYPIQTLDSRPAVVQVSNFPDQVRFSS